MYPSRRVQTTLPAVRPCPAKCLEACFAAGRDQIDKLDADLFIAGEMGIGNTSSASAITAALLQMPAADVVGPGTGVSGDGLERKLAAVSAALSLHRDSMESAEDVLRCVGGLEMAAMVGAYIRSAQWGIPILLDGFISTVAGPGRVAH